MPESILPHPRIPVAILAATGSVGQQFVHLLDGHPWFKVVALTGTEQRAGSRYGETCHWLLPAPMPDWAARMPVVPSLPENCPAALAFSALPADQARQIEPRFAEQGIWVCSNASAYRREPDVPILLPEVNPDHVKLVEAQMQARGWRAGIVCNPNCTSTGLTVALKALQNALGLRRVAAVSLQALSGAGYPGVASLDILDNVIPFIAGEEEKLEWEPRKMLGRLDGQKIALAEITFSAQVNRVAVSNGHLVCASVELGRPAAVEEAISALEGYTAPEMSAGLPSTPRPPIVYRREADRPQPRLDRDTGKGMTTVVGRMREDPLLGLKFIVLSHNTIRGAAGGAIFNAELLVSQGYAKG